MKITFLNGFNYDDEMVIEAGIYDFIEEGVNGYPMVLVNGEWLDFCDLESLDYEIK